MILEPTDLDSSLKPSTYGLCDLKNLIDITEPQFTNTMFSKNIDFPISPLIDILLVFTSRVVLVYETLTVSVVLINSHSLELSKETSSKSPRIPP